MPFPARLLQLADELEQLGLRIYREEQFTLIRGGFRQPRGGGLADWVQVEPEGPDWIVGVEPWRGQVVPKYRFQSLDEAAEFVLGHYRDGQAWPRSGFEQ